MQSNNYEWFISQTVEAMLPRFSSGEICLGMKIEMVWHYYHMENRENDKVFRKEFILLFHRPHNYTKVFLKEIKGNRVVGLQNKKLVMKKVSDHDSCWRTDGLSFIFKTFSDAWDYFDEFEIEGRKIEPSVHWSMFTDGGPAYYKIKFDKVEAEEQYGKIDYNVKIGEKIPMCEIGQYMPTEP